MWTITHQLSHCGCSRLSFLFFSFQVVIEAVNKPRNITYMGLTDLVTE